MKAGLHRNWHGVLVAVLLVVSVTRLIRIRAANAWAPPDVPTLAIEGYPCSGDGVYLYEDINYGGDCVRFTSSDPELGDDGFHDKASSIKFVGFSYANGRARATLYEHANYSGASSTFTSEDAWLGDDAIDSDRADSIRIEMVPFCDLVTEIPKAECEALVALYNSTGGPYWTNRSGWLENYYPSTWYGVRIAYGRVNRLNLVDNHLSGTIPDSLGSLSHMEWLNLYSNDLTGSIPPSLGSLDILQGLSLQGNGLTGGIPASLGNLGQLQYLALQDNCLTGSIPSSLGNLSSLSTLWLYDNELSGSIPSSLGGLSNLSSLELRRNQLSGSIPTSLGTIGLLSLIDLRWNQLTGTIPSSFGGLSSLSRLFVSNNPLEGPLPTSLTDLTSLVHFWFHDTNLCEPPDAAFQAWLATIDYVNSSGLMCTEATATPTATRTATPTRTPTPTATRTPISDRTPTPRPSGTPTLPPDCHNLLSNGDFESGQLWSWNPYGPTWLGRGRQGTQGAYLGGQVDGHAEIWQHVVIPEALGASTLRFWWRAEAAQVQPDDHLIVHVEYDAHDDQLLFLQSLGPLNTWEQVEIAFPAHIRGLALLGFVVGNGQSVPTTMRLDDIELLSCGHFLDLPLIWR